MPFSVRVFYLLLLLIFLAEGLGIAYGREVSFFLIVAAPFFLFSLDYQQKFAVKLPKTLAVLVLFFLVLIAASIVTAVNVQIAFEQSLLYLSLFLMLFFVANHQQEINKYLVRFIMSLAIVLVAYSVVLRLFNLYKIPLLSPTPGYQLIFPSYGGHNHLGDFLALALVIYFYNLFKEGFKIKSALWPALFVPPFLLSFSRSAYLSVFATLPVIGLLLFKRGKLQLFSSRLTLLVTLTAVGIFIYVAIVLSLSSVWEAQYVPIFDDVNQTLKRSLQIYNKGLSGSRIDYLGQALQSIAAHPLSGVGSGNFITVSYRYAENSYLVAASSHNLFFDIFSENGVPAGVVFSAILLLIAKRSKKGLAWLLFLALLINFQTDYTHRLYSMLLLFFVLAGLVYQEENKVTARFLQPVLYLEMLIVLLMLSSFVLVKNKQYRLAFYSYPLNSRVFPPLIEDSLKQGKKEEALSWMRIYGTFFPIARQFSFPNVQKTE